ncbi:MAG: acetyl-CoA carboxylase, biotin carboxyl carrier protein [Armatimonadota bacterium]
MSDLPVDPNVVARLGEISAQYGLDLIEYTAGTTTVRVTSNLSPVMVAGSARLPAVVSGGVDTPVSGTPVLAPIMGVYYRSPSPGEPPFVEIGDHVTAGDPIGTIEAMKVFSEVISEVTGVVVRIPADNGKLVHAGDSLIVVEEA